MATDEPSRIMALKQPLGLLRRRRVAERHRRKTESGQQKCKESLRLARRGSLMKGDHGNRAWTILLRAACWEHFCSARLLDITICTSPSTLPSTSHRHTIFITTPTQFSRTHHIYHNGQGQLLNRYACFPHLARSEARGLQWMRDTRPGALRFRRWS